MAKEIVSDKMIGEITKTIREISEKAMESSRETDLEKMTMELESEKRKEQRFKKEEDMVKKEFARVCRLLEDATPATQEYHELLDNLYDLKRVLGNCY